ncbi:MAG: protein tyrosine phosphatase [Alphaproteobacteria bacterium]|nr:protein tyrosine phosphatase [Alphaproteobacteria bacterium]
MRRFKRAALSLTGAILVVAALGGGYLGFLQLSGNFHAVIDGELYRSAQPTPARLAEYVRDYGIKTVVNLRGSNPAQGWYREEVVTASALGIAHIDFAMSARRVLAASDKDALLAILRDAPKPILIHCEAGADRSGLAAALYLAAIRGSGEETAKRQLSFRYGHIGLPYVSQAYPMDQSWRNFEPLFGFN